MGAESAPDSGDVPGRTESLHCGSWKRGQWGGADAEKLVGDMPTAGSA